MKHRIAIALALPLAFISACSAPKETEAPENTANAGSTESDEAVKQEAKSIETAANEAAALIEAEANAEIKAMGAAEEAE